MLSKQWFPWRESIWQNLLESSHADTEEDKADREACKSSSRMLDHRGNGGDNDDDVAQHSNADSGVDGFYSSPVCIGDVTFAC
jgi:hypothetical protein